MSKTAHELAYEILFKPDIQILPETRSEAGGRMIDAYADQRVNEYKEKLKAKFREGWLNPDLICNEIESTT